MDHWGAVGGYSRALACTVALRDGRWVFLKAAAQADPVRRMREELECVSVLPVQAPAPRFLWSLEVDGWMVMAFEAVFGRHPDLAPGSGDIPGYLQLVRETGA